MDTDVVGYWQPHTSSVDFCEPNYFVSQYIVEYHNTWSSLLITVLAIIGYLYGNPTNETRFTVMYLFLGVVGIGSTALHGTLHWFFQSSDEIPMLWQSLSLNYALWVMHEEKNSARTKTYGWAFATVGFLQTIVYYRFQQIYASFIIIFITSSILVTYWSALLAFAETNPNLRPIRVKLWFWGFVIFVVYGAGIWVVDFHMCSALMPYYLQTTGFTLHVLWHGFSSVGTFYIIQFLVAVRMQVLKMEPQVDFLFGFIPICRAAQPVRKLT